MTLPCFFELDQEEKHYVFCEPIPMGFTRGISGSRFQPV